MERRSFLTVTLLAGGAALLKGCGVSIQQTWDPGADHVGGRPGGCGRGLRRRRRLISTVPRDQQLRWMKEDIAFALTKPMSERQWILVINGAGCLDCDGCGVVCPPEELKAEAISNQKNVDAVAPGFRRTLWAQGLCGQCSDNKCVAACGTGALVRRDDGVATINQAACDACGSCVTACSDGGCSLVEVNGKKVASKCDLCVDIVDQGQLPRCVTTCSKGQVFFGDISIPDSFVAQLLGPELRLALRRRVVTLA